MTKPRKPRTAPKTPRPNPAALITPPPTSTHSPAATIPNTTTLDTPPAPPTDALDMAAAPQRDGIPAAPSTAAAIDVQAPSLELDTTRQQPDTVAFTIAAGHIERVDPADMQPVSAAASTSTTIDPTSSAAILGDPASEIVPPGSTLLAPSDVPIEIAGMGGVIVQSVALEDYTLDPKNANKGGERTDAILDRGLRKRGAGRSIFVGKNRRVIAGNQTLRRARAAGFTRAVEIVIPRDVLAVVRREDVDEDSEDGQLMAIEDNRSRDTSEWNPSIVAEKFDAGLIDDLLFRSDEVDALFASMTAEIDIQNATASTSDGESEKTRKLKQNKKQQVKAALYMDQLATYEQAITATGIDQRAEAVAAICRFYLDNAKKREAASV